MGEPEDSQEIIGLAVAYCQIVDNGDFGALRDIFAADATAELGGSGQNGIDEICDRLAVALGRFAGWEHQIEGHEVGIDGDTATASCSVRAVHFRPTGESPSTDTVIGTYQDKLVRTADGWRISHRTLVVLDRY